MQKMTPAILTGTVFGLLQSFGLQLNHQNKSMLTFSIIPPSLYAVAIYVNV